MARRDSLRDLQARLAERLQAVQNEAQHTGWLAVECAGRGLLFPLAGAGEIFPMSALMSVPHTLPWFAGVANLRGGLHGVVDLGAFLGLRPPRPAGDPGRDSARLLALNAALGTHCALMVDRLAGLRSDDQLKAVPMPAEGARPGFAGRLWRDAQGRDWQEIDLAGLASHPQFLGIAA